MTDVSKKIEEVKEKITPKGSKLKDFAAKGLAVAYQGAKFLSALKNNGIEINLVKVVQADRTPQNLPFMKDNSKEI